MKTAKRGESPFPEEKMSPKIDLEEIARLLQLIEEKNLTHFELEVEGFKIKISKENPAAAGNHLNPWPQVPPSANPSVCQPPTEADSQPQPQEILHFITSPMVGSFYRAPDPTSSPFVEVGDVVKKGQTLCIIEAMKLMNEIESDIEGIIKEIYVENGKPVEYGQRLFAIQPIS